MALSPDEKQAIEMVANLVKQPVSDQTPLYLLRHVFVTLDKLLKMARLPDEPDPKALAMLEEIITRCCWCEPQAAYEIHQALVRYYKTDETPTAPLTDEERQDTYAWVEHVIATWDVEAPSVLKTRWHNLKRMLDEQRAAEEEATHD